MSFQNLGGYGPRRLHINCSSEWCLFICYHDWSQFCLPAHQVEYSLHSPVPITFKMSWDGQITQAHFHHCVSWNVQLYLPYSKCKRFFLPIIFKTFCLLAFSICGILRIILEKYISDVTDLFSSVRGLTSILYHTKDLYYIRAKHNFMRF